MIDLISNTIFHQYFQIPPQIKSDLRLFNVSSLDVHVEIRGASQVMQW